MEDKIYCVSVVLTKITDGGHAAIFNQQGMVRANSEQNAIAWMTQAALKIQPDFNVHSALATDVLQGIQQLQAVHQKAAQDNKPQGAVH